jgi:hypothetical protein
VFSPIITTAGEILPGFVQPWIRAFAISPGVSVSIAIVILLLLVRSAYLKRCIDDGMRELWKLWVKPDSDHLVTYAGTFKNGPTGGIYALRSNRAYQKFFQWLKWRTIPGVFGATVLLGGLLLILAVILVAVQRVNIAWAERTNQYCQGAASGAANSFATDSKCWLSDFIVEKGKRYIITLRVTQDWIDRTIPTSPAGFESNRLRWYARPSVLLRRSLSGHWFQPMLKIIPASGRGGHIELLDMRCNCAQGPVYSNEFEARRSGKVALFVNDVMPPFFRDMLPGDSEFRDLYLNNRGTAEVSITAIPDKPQPR